MVPPSFQFHFPFAATRQPKLYLVQRNRNIALTLTLTVVAGHLPVLPGGRVFAAKAQRKMAESALPKIARLFDAIGPNPWAVRLALAAKGVDLASITHVLKPKDGVPENRTAPMTTRDMNPAGTTPYLQLEDGRVLAESVAMVLYADAALQGTPSFMGGPGALGQAEVLMWQRRVELQLVGPFQRQYQNGEGAPYFRTQIPWIDISGPSVPGLRQQVTDSMAWLDRDCLVDGQQCIAPGDPTRANSPSMADLQLYTTLEFMSNPKVNAAKLTPSFDPKTTELPKLPRLAAWFEHMAAWEEGVGLHLRSPVKPAKPAKPAKAT